MIICDKIKNEIKRLWLRLMYRKHTSNISSKEMEKMTRSEEYLSRITNYIFDGRFAQALLIDGDWGCGKTYFIKKDLIPEIDKTVVKSKTKDANDGRKKEECYKSIFVSLYGKTSINEIHEAIFTACFEKATDKISENETIKSVARNAPLLGSTILGGVGSFFNVGEETKKLTQIIKEGVLSSKRENTVLIFDDIERCRVDIIELMGFLNNLCENDGYRVILVANEEEIERQKNEIAESIQTSAALLDMDIKELLNKKNNNSESSEEEINSVLKRQLSADRTIDKNNPSFGDRLEEYRCNLFDINSQYERTREKLIGLTVRFSSSVADVYEDILKTIFKSDIAESKSSDGKNISISKEGKGDKENDIMKFLSSRKNIIIEAFNVNDYSNLRTLKSVFIASDNIFSNLVPEMESEKKDSDLLQEIIDVEKEKILRYLVLTAINIANGFSLVDLEGKRFGNVRGELLSNKPFITAYAFVNEYWESLTVDTKKLNTDFNLRINEELDRQNKILNDANHKNLALFELSEWYYRPDDEVINSLNKLKKEVKEKKYFSWEFKDIIYTLMCVNNPEFGMHPKNKEDGYVSSNLAYDPTDESSMVDIEQKIKENQKSSQQKHSEGLIDSKSQNEVINYKVWDKQNIEEYVGYMLTYFEDEDFDLTKEMLRIYSFDKDFAVEYKRYIQPLLDRINEKEIAKLKRENIQGSDVFENWDEKLYEFFVKNRDAYITRHSFLSLYGYDRIEKGLRDSSIKELINFSNAVGAVYNFGNLRDFFMQDYETVYKVWDALRKDREGERLKYNKNKERTREIALRRLEVNFDYYRKALRDPTETD